MADSSENANEEVANDQKKDGKPTGKEDEEGESTASTPSPSTKTKDKIDILLKATGDAPILKKKKWAVGYSKTMGEIMDFLRKLIKFDAADSLFVYINQSFAPAPDVEIGSLYECFGSDGKLILHYCKTQAWG